MDAARTRPGPLFCRAHRDATLSERRGTDIAAKVLERLGERRGMPPARVAIYVLMPE